MSESTALAGQVAGIVALAAFIPYIASILRGKTRPSKASWFIWTIVGAMLYLTYRASGGKHTLWMPMAYILGPLIVAILSLRFGEKGWTRLDSICITGTIISIPVWMLTSSPFLALTINLFVDFLATALTLRKSYLKPWTEDWFAWSLTAFSSLLNLFAVEEWSWYIGTYPVYMMLFNGLIFAFIFCGQRFSKKVA